MSFPCRRHWESQCGNLDAAFQLAAKVGKTEHDIFENATSTLVSTWKASTAGSLGFNVRALVCVQGKGKGKDAGKGKFAGKGGGKDANKGKRSPATPLTAEEAEAKRVKCVSLCSAFFLSRQHASH